MQKLHLYIYPHLSVRFDERGRRTMETPCGPVSCPHNCVKAFVISFGGIKISSCMNVQTVPQSFLPHNKNEWPYSSMLVPAFAVTAGLGPLRVLAGPQWWGPLPQKFDSLILYIDLVINFIWFLCRQLCVGSASAWVVPFLSLGYSFCGEWPSLSLSLSLSDSPILSTLDASEA